MESLGLSGTFWGGRRVLVTGHTGFKGSWLCLWLARLASRVHGYALPPVVQPSLFDLADVASGLSSNTYGDIRDGAALAAVFEAAQPEIVFHLAAQPLVRVAFREPVETFSVNVVGTAQLLECARRARCVRAIVVVTSDKCYADTGTHAAHHEDDRLGGGSPYAASKACAELVTDAYRSAYFGPADVRVASARAGNVIGGGDWAEDRLVPDIERAARSGATVALRHPNATRPWQHVLECLSGYLMLAERLAGDAAYAGAWNFGPALDDCRPVRWLAERVAAGLGVPVVEAPDAAVPEAATLMLDNGKSRERLGWKPRLSLESAIDWTTSWYAGCRRGEDAAALCRAQLQDYAALALTG